MSFLPKVSFHLKDLSCYVKGCFKGSTNPSIMGYWSEYALKHECIGMTFTNAAPMMVPTGAKEVRTEHSLHTVNVK